MNIFHEDNRSWYGMNHSTNWPKSLQNKPPKNEIDGEVLNSHLFCTPKT
jgi:hypothetical protein